jgi:hypothetical protein
MVKKNSWEEWEVAFLRLAYPEFGGTIYQILNKKYQTVVAFANRMGLFKNENIPIIGKKYFNLKVLRRKGSRKNQKNWECICDCGKICERLNNELVGSNYLKLRKSCGCFLNREGIDSPIFKGYKELPHRVFSKIKGEAAKRNIDFNITIEEMWNLFLKQNRKCALTGVKIYFPKSSKDENIGNRTASLDRIDSGKGYTIDNVQWVHKDVNIMKRDIKQDRFIEICDTISKYNFIEEYDDKTNDWW